MPKPVASVFCVYIFFSRTGHDFLFSFFFFCVWLFVFTDRSPPYTYGVVSCLLDILLSALLSTFDVGRECRHYKPAMPPKTHSEPGIVEHCLYSITRVRVYSFILSQMCYHNRVWKYNSCWYNWSSFLVLNTPLLREPRPFAAPNHGKDAAQIIILLGKFIIQFLIIILIIIYLQYGLWREERSLLSPLPKLCVRSPECRHTFANGFSTMRRFNDSWISERSLGDVYGLLWRHLRSHCSVLWGSISHLE